MRSKIFVEFSMFRHQNKFSPTGSERLLLLRSGDPSSTFSLDMLFPLSFRLLPVSDMLFPLSFRLFPVSNAEDFFGESVPEAKLYLRSLSFRDSPLFLSASSTAASHATRRLSLIW